MVSFLNPNMKNMVSAEPGDCYITEVPLRKNVSVKIFSSKHNQELIQPRPFLNFIVTRKSHIRKTAQAPARLFLNLTVIQ